MIKSHDFQHEQQALNALVDAFAVEMKRELHRKRIEGRGGWDQVQAYEGINAQVADHVDRSDWISIANLAAFLWNLAPDYMRSEADQNSKAFGSTRSADGRYPI